MTELQDAALRLVRAYDARTDASNGQGHGGESHDRALWFPDPSMPDGVEMHSTVDDCARCQGTLYGIEDETQQAIVDIKVALGEPLREYEKPYLVARDDDRGY